jgi:5-methyltetrahydrofolate--homocysteine methyltransferase
MNRHERVTRLKALLDQRLLVLDGAMGTALQGLDLKAADFGGPEYEGCNEYLVVTRPDAIAKVHDDYFAAGADVAETNSFGSTPLVLAEYGLADRARELNRVAAEIARQSAARFSTPERPRFVAGSMGPTTKALSVTGGVTFDALIEHYYVQAQGLYEGGVDYFLLETCQDTRNVKAGVLALQRLNGEVEAPLPIAVSGTIEPMGTMLAGQSVEALANSLEHLDLLYLGLNCATGPEFMTDHLRSLSALTHFRVSCVPNAGLPDESGHYLETPEMLARAITRFGEAGWLNVVGGCCGTVPAHIRAIAEAARALTVRRPPTERKAALSGIDYLEMGPEQRPIVVGERTNVIGSRKFKELIRQEKFDEASEIARAQVKSGAQVIDICLADPDRDELADMEKFLQAVTAKVRVPLVIDSTDHKVLARALTYCQGKSLINSVNLEDGEERFEKVVPLAKAFGAALVVGTIDDDPQQGMAVKRERKLEVAERAFGLLTEKYGIAPEDIYWDPLVFPCATGDGQYVGSAVETIEGVRLLKERFPRTHTVLGISNVSFGLPPAGREVLNAVFLYHCTQAGLDLALVNAEKLPRFPSIPPEERKLSEDLLWNRGPDPVAAFAAYFRERKPPAKEKSTLSLDERLAGYIVEGSKDGLHDDLALALADRTPLQIINGPLMAGMDEVGRLFAQNQLIVAEVLQSAESMKSAVGYLEPHMDKAQTASRGKVLLATVKGDVHDIGKNLVEIILANNGFQVVNLGIKVPPADLITAARQHQPDIIGLSGLLVKSAHQMVATAEDLNRAGLHVPILVGGAALSRNFVDKQIAPAYGAGTVAYAKDGMQGLDLARQIVEPARFEDLKEALRQQRAKLVEPRKQDESELGPRAAAGRSASLPVVADPPKPPDFERHVLTNTPLPFLWKFINPLMLYGRHLGFKGALARTLESADPSELRETEAGRKALEVRQVVNEVKAECEAGLMKPVALYQFVRAESDGNRLILLDALGGELCHFDFPRQPRQPGLSLADLVNPRGAPADAICAFVTSAGAGIRGRAEELKQQGNYLKSHVLQALALETAEAYAELLHAKIRSLWGFPDGVETTMLDRFKANYRGKRYSFGYPACPRLEDQQILFQLLRPEEIGVALTDGCMMDPEASVSALVFHHPDAHYFSVLEDSPAAAEVGT